MFMRYARGAVLAGVMIGGLLGLVLLSDPPAVTAKGNRPAPPKAPVYVPGQYIVIFKDAVANPRTEAAQMAVQYGMQLLHVYADSLKGFSAKIPDAAVPLVTRDGRVQYVERDQVVTISQIVIARPDLIITSLSASPTSVAVNENVTVTVKVKNIGSVASGGFAVSIYKNLSTVPNSGTPRSATQNVAGLAAGATTTLTFNITYPNTGTKSLRAFADSNGVIAESNEFNNVAGPVSVTVGGGGGVPPPPPPPPPPSQPGPDLIVSNLVASPQNAAPLQQISVTVEVTNQGTQGAGAFDVSIYKNLSTTPTINTPKDATKSISSLGAGAKQSVTFIISYSNNGNFQLRALADSRNRIIEPVENNNAGGPVTISISSTPTPPPSGNQQTPNGVRRIGGTESSTISGNGSGTVNVVVAVLDTGIDLSFTTELNVVFNKSFVVGSVNGNDGNGHGTHVAGIIAAKDNSTGVVGVAPGAKLWALKVLNNQGNGNASDIIAGIDFVRQNAAFIHVANMSLEGSFSQAVNDAVKSAVNSGVTIVVSAGDGRRDVSGISPASEASAITVSALADSDGQAGGTGGPTPSGPDDTFAAFSNFGPGVDFIAPGVNIRSTYRGGSLATISGTSQAAAHVTGIAALFKGSNPNATPAQVRQAIVNSVTEQIPGINNEGRSYPLPSARPF